MSRTLHKARKCEFDVPPERQICTVYYLLYLFLFFLYGLFFMFISSVVL